MASAVDSDVRLRSSNANDDSRTSVRASNKASASNASGSNLSIGGPAGNDITADGTFDEAGRFVRSHGYNWFIAGLFLVGDMAGGGIVAMPRAIKDLGFYGGIVFALICGLLAGWMSIILGKCWCMLQDRYLEYRVHSRRPYGDIAYRAIGRWAQHVVQTTINVNQFGVSLVYILLSAKTIHDALILHLGHSLHYCFIFMILSLIVFPFMLLKSPEDFWWIVIAGMFCSVGSFIMIFIGGSMDLARCADGLDRSPATTFGSMGGWAFLSALGTVIFSFGGHSGFVTIQHDMVKPYEFTGASILAFVMITGFYVPSSAFAYYVYGQTIQSSIINSIQVPWCQQTINMLIMFHCLFTAVFVINPLNQDVEEMLGVPQSFGWKRVASRGGVMLVLVFCGLSVPTFGPLLDLVGASTTLFTVMVYPPIFYVFLIASGELKEEGKVASLEEPYPRATISDVMRVVNRPLVILCIVIVGIGLLFGISSSISAIHLITNERFEPPCYVNWFHHQAVSGVNRVSTYCCGPNFDRGPPNLANGTCLNSQSMPIPVV